MVSGRDLGRWVRSCGHSSTDAEVLILDIQKYATSVLRTTKSNGFENRSCMFLDILYSELRVGAGVSAGVF